MAKGEVIDLSTAKPPPLPPPEPEIVVQPGETAQQIAGVPDNPGRRQVWTPEMVKRLRFLYVNKGLPVRKIAPEFGLSEQQVSAKIRHTNFHELRKRANADAGDAVAQYNKRAVERHKAFLEKLEQKAAELTDKATGMAEGSLSPRELSASVGAMKTLVDLYHRAAGIDSGPSRGATTFNFNFASTAGPRPIKQVEQDVDV